MLCHNNFFHAGAGIYVSYSQYYAGRQAAQPNNTYLSVYSSSYSVSRYTYIRFNIYCCSNASSSYVGSFTDPYATYTSNFHNLRIQTYSSSSTYAGCVQLDGYQYYRYTLSFNSGVHTCNIQDANGQTQNVHFALYSIYSKNNIIVTPR